MNFTGSPGGGIGGSLSAGGPLTPQGIVQLLRLLGGKRKTEQLGPGSFPGYNPDGSPMDTDNDPWQYANFQLPPNQTPGINPGTRTPQAGPAGAGTNIPAVGGIGSRIWKGLNSPFGQQAIAAGTGLIGARMASGQMNKANEINRMNSERSYEMAQEEKRRRDALIKMIMPMLAQGMQVRDPERVRQMVGG